MSGFRKANPSQAAVKVAIYGPAGSGKTFSTLLFAEGIAKQTSKRIAFVDTERGTDFYAMDVPTRKPHPGAFDFDAIYTRSITEVLTEVQKLDPSVHSVIVLDSISHLWDAAMAAYSGPKTKVGGIPMHAWSRIKAPYKALMKFLIDSKFHVFILGRQANVFEEDHDTGETKAAGVKMRAEGETAYEPHICLRMIPQRTEKQGKKTVVNLEQVVCAFAEKDRTGTIAGQMIPWPTFENVIAPLMGLMHGEQAPTPSEDDAAAQDSENLAKADRDKVNESHNLSERYQAKIKLCETKADLDAVGKELTPFVKKQFTAHDLEIVRTAYGIRQSQLNGKAVPEREPGEEG